MTADLVQNIIGAIGFVLLVAWIVYYLMQLDPPDEADHEYLSAGLKMMKGNE